MSAGTSHNIAEKAGVSRGAMLHHFPTQFDLIRASVNHLSQDWLMGSYQNVLNTAKHLDSA